MKFPLPTGPSQTWMLFWFGGQPAPVTVTDPFATADVCAVGGVQRVGAVRDPLPDVQALRDIATGVAVDVADEVPAAHRSEPDLDVVLARRPAGAGHGHRPVRHRRCLRCRDAGVVDGVAD